MSSAPGAVKRLWWRWKSLRLPWRKRWLVGFDLAGNTFWEFKDALHAGRLRRIVAYSRSVHLSDVNLSPQWVQWLRHTRNEAPSINEQQLDEIRQAQMKELAARADARWAAKPSALDRPATQPYLEPSPSSPPQENMPSDFEHQSQVAETVAESAESLAKGTPMQKQEAIQQEEVPQDTLSSQAGHQHSKTKEFKGYKLGREGEQQPESWAPKAARRR